MLVRVCEERKTRAGREERSDELTRTRTLIRRTTATRSRSSLTPASLVAAWLIMNDRPEELEEYHALKKKNKLTGVLAKDKETYSEYYEGLKDPKIKVEAETDWKRFCSLNAKCERLIKMQISVLDTRDVKMQAFKNSQEADKELEAAKDKEKAAGARISNDHVVADEARMGGEERRGANDVRSEATKSCKYYGIWPNVVKTTTLSTRFARRCRFSSLIANTVLTSQICPPLQLALFVAVAELFPTIQVGFVCTSVNGNECEGEDYDTIMNLIVENFPPHTIQFRRYDYRRDMAHGNWWSLQELRDQNKYVEDPRLTRGFFTEICRKGNIAEIDMRLKRGADVNAYEAATGQTGLHLAASNSHLECMQLLLARGADIETRDRNLDTPLLLAARR